MGRRDDAQFFEKQQLKWKTDGVLVETAQRYLCATGCCETNG
ncbi:hypothetical protein [Chitinophaga defluvii]|uniref:Uncharacterized protein n=1 Tax=Chitinophaga defluvii TaxID=3163343 RepID=A0ABV2T7X5_9BACT